MSNKKPTILDYIWFGLVIWFVGYLVLYAFGITGRDATDDTQSRQRSGLTLYTDYGTGCQYIKGGWFGSTIPRVDKNGKHVCLDALRNP